MATGTLALIGALGAAAVSGGAAIYSSSQQRKAQQAANAANADINASQLQFQKDMYEDAKEYNTPSAQRERFEQAGINPYLAMGATSNGNVEAMTAPSQIGMQPVNATPFEGISQLFKELGVAPNRAAELERNYEQINAVSLDNDAKRIELQYKNAEKILNLQEKRAQISSILSNRDLTEDERVVRQKQASQLDEQIKSLEISNKYLDERSRAETDEAKNNAALRYQEIVGQRLQNYAQELANRYFPKLKQAEIQSLSSAAYQALMSGKHEETLNKNDFIRRFGINLENRIKYNQLKYSDFGLPAAQLKGLLEAMRTKGIIVGRENPFFQLTDDVLNWARYYTPFIEQIK